jgi:hypothetical protein
MSPEWGGSIGVRIWWRHLAREKDLQLDLGLDQGSVRQSV